MNYHSRSIVLVGLMGVGKTTVGRCLAARLGLPFRDTDAELEAVAGCTVADVFARYGESHFRAEERRVMCALLHGPPSVLATGGGAFMDPCSRAAVRSRGISVWLQLPLPVLLGRVANPATRPLLAGTDPAEVLQRLSAERSSVYAEADIAIDCAHDDTPEQTAARVIAALATWRPR